MAEPSDHGNVSVLLTAVVVVAIMLCAAIAGLGSAAAEKARANNAADAAALAAAGGLALGRTPAEACAMARSTAVDNGARLLTCHCADAIARIVVELGEAQARAQADVGDRR
jgi:secretion/DNA translocation related TadE-like protein